MFPGEDHCDDDYYGINPYESFMRRHLQHYGYYTGKNQNYKNQFQQYAEWEKNYAYNLSNSSSSDGSLSDSDDDKHSDNKLQDDLLRTTQLIYSCGDGGKMVPRLREPRSLYALNKELGPQQAARWPSDLQVLRERIKHIQTPAPEPEPFYRQTGFEKCPMVRGEANGGRIVYCYETNSSFFMKSRVGGSRDGCEQCAVSLESEDDTTLIFESRFESGNLGKAVQIGENEYELWLRYDLYTNKHTQWFYFRVSNTRADKEYRFTIVNFMKPDSLYNNGMRPVMYSDKEAALNKVGWRRAGNNIKYYRNNVRYEQGKGDQYFYSVTWTVKMPHDDDTVYFSHCYPYTYTDLQDYLLELTNDPIKSRICKQRVLCRTLAGNLVYVLTITSSSQNPEDVKHKKAVVVTARVHPGESNSSWMMKGFLDFVTGNSPDAKLLRDTFIFKVVPMLNPDGVVVGNYRCSLAGRDLNRNYRTAMKDAYPPIWHTKSLIRKLLMERSIIVYCDLHGHSRRQNVFIYGCEQHPTYGISNHSGSSNLNSRKFHERVFPSMLSKNSPEKFCFKSCKFKVQKSKEGTGRVVVWNMGVQNSYTMEATFCGSSLGKKKGLHFNQCDFEMMGYHFCDTLLDYCDPDNTKYTKILVDLEDKHKMEVVTKIAQRGLQPEAVDMMDSLSTDTESSTGGSDSDVSDGPPVHLQYAAARPKKKKLKSKRDRDKARKEEIKKLTTQQEEKRLRHNQVKPLKPDLSSKATGQPIRYTSTSPKRPRSLDERSNTGIPVFVQERFDEKQQKRNDYLEALTAAYISNNIPINNDPAYVKYDINYSKGLPKSASLQGLRGRASAGLARSKSAIVATASIWAPPSTADDSQQAGVVHFRYSGTTERPANPQALEGLCPHHEQALTNQLAAAAQTNSAVSLVVRDGSVARDRVSQMFSRDAAFKISRLVARTDNRRHNPGTMEDLVRAHLNQPSASSTSERRAKPHLLEVSAAQQRQTDALSRDKYSSGQAKSQSGSATETFKKEDQPKAQDPPKTCEEGASAEISDDKAQRKNGSKDKERSGRKSRKGMHDEGEEIGFQPRIHSAAGDIFDGKGPSTRPPRVKSARSTPGMATALSSIQEIQKSLQSTEGSNQQDNLEANATGEYIQQLIKETNDEIEGLTHEIQEDIEKKQQYMRVRDEVAKTRRIASQIHRQQQQQQNGERALSKSKAAMDAKGQASAGRAPLGVGYHGMTFVDDITRYSEPSMMGGTGGGTQTHTGIRALGQFSGAAGGGGLLSQATPPIVKPPNTHIPYSNSSLADPPRVGAGPNLMVGGANNKRQHQLSLEEEARRRSLKRHGNLTSAGNGSGTTQPTALQQQLQQPCYSLSDMRENPASFQPMPESASLATPFRQLSSHSYQGVGPSPLGTKLNKQTLVFKTDSPNGGAHSLTPRGAADEADLWDNTTEQARSRSARSGSRQVVEAVPTKISLMICSEHQESSATPPGHFLPLSRQGSRPPLLRAAQARKREGSTLGSAVGGREELDSRHGRRK